MVGGDVHHVFISAKLVSLSEVLPSMFSVIVLLAVWLLYKHCLNLQSSCVVIDHPYVGSVVLATYLHV